jgi:glutaredoxin
VEPSQTNRPEPKKRDSRIKGVQDAVGRSDPWQPLSRLSLTFSHEIIGHYLRERKVPFKEINVERDEAAARDVRKKTGQAGVPVVKIGSKWIVGFDRAAIDRELAKVA